MSTYNTKVHLEQGGETLVVESGGVIDIKTGGKLLSNGAQGAALTAQVTTITHTAPGTPDYAIQDLINTSAYGFATKDEGNTVLSVIKNLQTRLAEVEARLEAAGIVIAN
ncbi:hypothetical protein [Nitrosomonas communis]|uniref:hypothetical protein n=1 Tax=Nitrosomonas communis TaxID=44574 RepID=UPI003D2CFD45